MNKIYVNGASYCNGFMLDNYKEDEIHEKSWLSFIKKDFNIFHEIKNGKSIYDIYTESISYLENNTIDLFIAIIPFNDKEKNSYYLKNLNNNYEKVNIIHYDDYLKIKKDYLISDNLINYFYFKDEEEYYINKFIKNMELFFSLIQYLKNKKTKFLLFLDYKNFYENNYLELVNKIDKKEKKYLELVFNIVKNNSIGMMDQIYDLHNLNKNEKKIDDLIITKDNNIMTAHPSELAHKIFYDYLINKLKEHDV